MRPRAPRRRRAGQLTAYVVVMKSRCTRRTASPDLEVRRKCLRIAMEMVSTRSVSDVVAFLKKELVKAAEDDYDKVKLACGPGRQQPQCA